MTTLEKLKQVQHDFHHAVNIMRNIADGYGWSKIVENCEKSVSLIPSIIKEIEAVRLHAISQDCGRICDGNPSINYRKQWEASKRFVDNLVRTSEPTEDA